ncbi:uncharacterized protein F4822DRAFT_433054 [Hypoxylon trugodes]|uniref:uncharacterized protein n=1 Tax=Hypoxylon trugodes TaxID=326681 RepID=UPI002191E130|nr:uncharacterized protein F4822DRAFT_433054 [Hypoxylon trugodes]KAI1384510.1 hypothetical protein F4822DRAFT_433054 [Hypoxylon trugodes]
MDVNIAFFERARPSMGLELPAAIHVKIASVPPIDISAYFEDGSRKKLSVLYTLVTRDGQELAQKLRECWPDVFARTPAERRLCSALDIVRWVASIVAEDESCSLDLFCPLQIILLALIDFPIVEYTNTDTNSQIHSEIASCVGHLVRDPYDGSMPDLLDILESPLMKNNFWAQPCNLLYKSTVLEQRDGTIHPIKIPPQNIAKEGLIIFDDPARLAQTVEWKLGRIQLRDQGAYRCYVPSPPEFLRFRWNNSAWVAQNSGKEARDILQKLEIRTNDTLDEGGHLTFPAMIIQYRLICIAKIPEPGEEPTATQIFMNDGHRFFGQHGICGSRFWSPNAPGSYYLIYHKLNKSSTVANDPLSEPAKQDEPNLYPPGRSPISPITIKHINPMKNDRHLDILLARASTIVLVAVAIDRGLTKTSADCEIILEVSDIETTPGPEAAQEALNLEATSVARAAHDHP